VETASYELETELGLGGVVLWRDRTVIEPGDKWSDKIIEALRGADILLVVLSRTYITQEWCDRELETFASRIETASGLDYHRRILRVDKHTLEDAQIPAVLRPIQAVRFFEYDSMKREDRPFFWRGLVRDEERFYEALRTLAVAIERAVKGLTRVYLLHHENDRRFAVDIAKALKAHGLTVKLPSIDGEPQEQRMLHRQRLAESDAVLLCWRDGSGTWVEIAASELRDFRKLGRDRPFLCRTVLLGGEATAAKLEYLDIYSHDDVVQVLDGTGDKLSAALTEFLNLLQGTKPGRRSA
jgi:hypothetical protein